MEPIFKTHVYYSSMLLVSYSHAHTSSHTEKFICNGYSTIWLFPANNTITRKKKLCFIASIAGDNKSTPLNESLSRKPKVRKNSRLSFLAQMEPTLLLQLAQTNPSWTSCLEVAMR